jgi:hypothetical protein
MVMSMVKRTCTIISVIIALNAAVPAQPTLEVIGLDGTAKVQGVKSQKWVKLAVGDKCIDNDIVETFFRARVTLRAASGVIVIIGANSKALLNLAAKEVSGKKTFEAGFSLFSGGIYTKAIANAHLTVFTTSAVGEIDSGTLAVAVDAKSSETGLFALGGSAQIRNIAQQKGSRLASGQACVVLPGREPAPPVSLSFRHVAELKRFFGDGYISEQLRLASISPVADQGTDSRIMPSLGVALETQSSGQFSYQRVFNVNKIFGSILDERDLRNRLYAPVVRPAAVAERDASIAFSGGAELAGGSARPAFSAIPRYRNRAIDAALRFSIAEDYSGAMTAGFNSLAGVLDKIDHVTVGSVEDSLYCTAGTLTDITCGRGLIVDRFRNTGNNRLFHPLGIAGKANLFSDLLNVNAFLADATDPSLAGIHISLQPSIYYFGAGYYLDRNQYHRPADDTGNLRFTRAVASSASIFPDTSRVKSDVEIYELDLGVTAIDNYALSLRMYCEFAQKIYRNANDGYVLRVPSFEARMHNWSMGGGLLMESGRLVSQEFNEFYSSRRSYLKSDTASATPVDTLLTQNTSLWKRRNATSLFFSLGMNLSKGTDISLGYTHNLFAKNFYAVWAEDSATDTAQASPHDFSLDLRLSVDRNVIPYVKYGTLYVRQSHAKLFPRSGTYFSSWNTEAGFDIISEPLYIDLSLEAGGRLFYLDGGPHPNNTVDDRDRIMEFFAAIVWGFL